MKLKDGFLLRQLAGEYVVVPVGGAAVDLRGMISLNETGAFLWELLQTEQTERQLLTRMLEEYEVEESAAKADIARFTDELNRHGMLA